MNMRRLCSLQVSPKLRHHRIAFKKKVNTKNDENWPLTPFGDIFLKRYTYLECFKCPLIDNGGYLQHGL